MDKEIWEMAMSAIQEVAQEGMCPLCGNVNTADAMTTCPNCGGMVPADSKFCPNCGYELNNVSEPGDI